MSYSLPHLVWLRAFEAAARASSFTAAAAELNLTPAAVSHQTRALEKHLGFALFDRLPHGLRLTEMGRAYLPPVRKAFDELSMSTAGLFGPLGERSVTVRAPISYATLCLAPRLAAFRRAYPAINLRLSTSVWAEAMGDGAVDVDIRYGDGRWPDHEVQLLDDAGSVPVCAPDARPARRDARARLEALGAGEVIHIMGCEDLWTRLLRLHGLPEIVADSGFKADTSLVALEAAAAGQGCALVLKSFAESYLRAGRLVLAADVELPPEQAHYVLLPQGRSRAAPEAMLFREWLIDGAGPPP